jgi:IS30 family transposase
LPKFLVSPCIGVSGHEVRRDDSSVFTAPKGARQLRRRLSLGEVAELEQGYQAGKTVYELAAEFGVTRQTVSRHLKRRGVAMRRQGIAERDRAEAARLRGQGWSYARLGERFGVDGRTVWSFLRKGQPEEA